MAGEFYNFLMERIFIDAQAPDLMADQPLLHVMWGKKTALGFVFAIQRDLGFENSERFTFQVFSQLKDETGMSNAVSTRTESGAFWKSFPINAEQFEALKAYYSTAQLIHLKMFRKEEATSDELTHLKTIARAADLTLRSLLAQNPELASFLRESKGLDIQPKTKNQSALTQK